MNIKGDQRVILILLLKINSVFDVTVFSFLQMAALSAGMFMLGGRGSQFYFSPSC